jgi:hypothetical protein
MKESNEETHSSVEKVKVIPNLLSNEYSALHLVSFFNTALHLVGEKQKPQWNPFCLEILMTTVFR